MVDVVHHLDQRRYVEERGEAVTANLLFTRRTLDVAGPFDSSLASGGDREWVRRAVRAGAELAYADDVVATHPPRTRARQLIRKSVRVARGGSDLRAAGRPEGRRPYADPWTLVPRHRRTGRRRLAENGHAPTALRWLLVNAGSLAYVQLPQAAAALRADVRRRRS